MVILFAAPYVVNKEVKLGLLQFGTLELDGIWVSFEGVKLDLWVMK